MRLAIISNGRARDTTAAMPGSNYRWPVIWPLTYLPAPWPAKGRARTRRNLLLVCTKPPQQLTWTGLLADAGYDAEHNHRRCRERLGIPTTLIALNKRGAGRKWPKTTYRRQMKRDFAKTRYNQRWHIESAIARHKRRLGTIIQARSLAAQLREGYLQVITHNLMILPNVA